ncbi:glycoside hydrolase family 88 protein [Mucilaginibacter sp. HMF5004]|uniref:glycoside hydrolase family 88 protein n=1 Tax=Mucilaginibacter rivuli TaxID=2857527 RepID=UPI001C602E8D|nr:glycoside hydrolase family 88 protein [Mucilaginibacter rivuli]MBW4888563.1 glycoside hydrolase family 88 protein [Mucilaginibacter rivuli]
MLIKNLKGQLSAIILGVLIASSATAQKVDVAKEFKSAELQTSYMLNEVKDIVDTSKTLVSPRTFENGKFKMVKSNDWTSGFFPGILWYIYDYTKDTKWMEQAKIYTAKIEKEQFNKGTHDLGFMVYCSVGNAYRLTKDERYKAIIIQAAKSLSTRFNPKTGVIKSWDHNKDNKWTYPVIIDNMMNLELLFEATKLSGDSSFYKIAISHANTTMKNHFRADNSSYHMVDYDPATGNVIKKITVQGYADESAWARGQAWGLYGFTVCYRETHDKKYLEQAQKIEKFIFSSPTMPKDLIPYWDHNDPAIPNTPRDVSAAAITASALLELSTYTKNTGYKAKANTILYNLSQSYKAPINTNGNFILLHSTGHKPIKSEVDVPLTYADYYYLEALLRSKRMK